MNFSIFPSLEQTKTISRAASNLLIQKKKSAARDFNETSTSFIQSKLTIGSFDATEAGAMADKVMPILKPISFSSGKNSVQKKCEHCEEEDSGDSISVAPPIIHDVIKSSSGKSLDESTRSFMEPRFNYDFSKVKIHDNDLAAKSASSINALAYTSGNNVVFNSGQYNTNSDSGKRLLAHELTHVMQQENSIRRKMIQRQESTEGVEVEQSEFSNDAEELQLGPSTPLQVGDVVRVELRSGPTVEEMTNNYPVSPNGCLNLPMVGCIVAKGKTTTKIRAEIEQALKGGFLKFPTVNVSSANKTVDYTHAVQPGESVYIRVLGASGNVEFEGDFPVDSSGQIHVPMAGDMTIQGKNFASIEAEITKALLNGFLKSTTVHVADKKI